LTADEFVAGQRVFCRYFARPVARFHYRYAIPIGIFFMADGAVALALQLGSGLALFLFAWGAYSIASKVILGPQRAKKEFARAPDAARERNMEFDDDKILVQTLHSKGEVDWGHFDRFVETEKLFVLLAPPRGLYTIPKRAFSSDESNVFRELLRRKLKPA
jgi:YcxB-like protein